MSFFIRQDDVVNIQKEQLKNWWDQADKYFKLTAWFIYTSTLQYIAGKTGSKTIWVLYVLASFMLGRIFIRIIPLFIDYIMHNILGEIYPNLHNRNYIYDFVVVVSIIFSFILSYYFNFHTFPAIIKSISDVRSKS